MRVVIVGAGGAIGQRHARVVRMLGHEVVACDTRPDLLAEVMQRNGLHEGHADYGDALARPADAVIVCTPNHLHAPVAVEAFRRGCHVLVEKPIAHTLADAAAILEAAQASGKALMVGYTLRQFSGLHALRQRLADGAIGKPLGARAILGAARTLTVARTDYRKNRSMGGGAILDYTHELDYLRLLLGEVAEVACIARVLDHLPTQTESLVAMILQFASGAVGEVHLDYVQPGIRRLEVIGERGLLTFDFGIPSQTVDTIRTQLTQRDWNAADGTAAAPDAAWETTRDEPYLQQFRMFARRMAGQDVPRAQYADGPDAQQTLAVALAAIASSDERRFVAPHRA